MTNGLLLYGEIFEHFLIYYIGSPSSYMTLQLLQSEFPYIWGKFYFPFLSLLLSVYKEPRPPHHCEKSLSVLDSLSKNSFIKDRQSRCRYRDIFPTTATQLKEVTIVRVKVWLPIGRQINVQASLIKKENQIFSYIRKFRMEQLQSHIWLTASSYMGKYLSISSYIRKPFLINDLATSPVWISLYMRKI